LIHSVYWQRMQKSYRYKSVLVHKSWYWAEECPSIYLHRWGPVRYKRGALPFSATFRCLVMPMMRTVDVSPSPITEHKLCNIFFTNSHSIFFCYYYFAFLSIRLLVNTSKRCKVCLFSKQTADISGKIKTRFNGRRSTIYVACLPTGDARHNAAGRLRSYLLKAFHPTPRWCQQVVNVLVCLFSTVDTQFSSICGAKHQLKDAFKRLHKRPVI